MNQLYLKDSRIYAITVNWNKPSYTIECVNSLLNQEGVLVEVVIVDNGSSDDSVDILKNTFPSIKLIRLEQNSGFSVGYNEGIRYALSQGAEYIFIINNDATIEKDSLYKLRLTLSENTKVVSPLIFIYGHPDQIWSSGGHINFLIMEPLDSHNRNVSIDSLKVTERTFLTGCALLFHKSVLETVGFFDENMFMYYEDLDLSMRIVQAKIKMAINPEAKAYHRVSSSSGGNINPFERYHMGRSSGIYFRKHAKGLRIVPILIYRMVSTIKISLILLFKRNTDSLINYWKGLFDGWVKYTF